MSTPPTTAGLGSLVWWDLHQTRITPAALRELLQAEGWDPSFVVDIDPISAVKATAAGFTQGRGKEDRYRADLVSSTRTQAAVGLQRRTRTGPRKVSWPQVATLTFDTALSTQLAPYDDAWTVQVQGPAPDTLGAAVDAFQAQARDRILHLDHTLLRPKLIQAHLDAWGAFRLRQQGGTCYVPPSRADDCRTLQRIVSQLPGAVLHIAHLQDTSEGRTSIGTAAQHHLQAALAPIQADLSAWQARGSARSGSLAVRLQELDTLRAHARLYQADLGVWLRDVRVYLEQAHKSAQALLEKSLAYEVEASKRSGRRPSVEHRDRIRATREAHGDVVPLVEMEALGWTASALRHAAYWSGNLRPTLRAMGLRAKLDKAGGVVRFTPMPSGPVGTFPDDTDTDTDTDAKTDVGVAAPVPAPEPASAPPALPPPAPAAAPDTLPLRSRAPRPQIVVTPILGDDGSFDIAEEDLKRVARSEKPADLRARYHAATGQPAPDFGRGYSKLELVADVLAAEHRAAEAGA